MCNENTAPSGLMCERLEMPEKTYISTAHPTMSWIMRDPQEKAFQTAYRIQVATARENLEENAPDVWDSGKVLHSESANVPFNGPSLQSHSTYFWRVMTWNQNDKEGLWSDVQEIHTGSISSEHTTAVYPLEWDEIEPDHGERKSDEHLFIDFGKAAFGTIKFTCTCKDGPRAVTIHFGEALEKENTIDRSPPGTIRYRATELTLKEGCHSYTVPIPPDERNTRALAIQMPEDVGEVIPFRYCEIEGVAQDDCLTDIRQIAVHYPFNENAASFSSSDEILNRIWDLCKYSIKATSFCGVYVDGDRERIPYEGDAYINQLSHYAVDREYSMARRSHEYLIKNATWFTDWYLHSVFMAWQDYMYTGNPDSLSAYYEDLHVKTLRDLARDDGLLCTGKENFSEELLNRLHAYKAPRDLVDWPPGAFQSTEPEERDGERDGHDMREVNTVINAYHFHALMIMANIATVLNKTEDAEDYQKRAEQVRTQINNLMLDRERGIYIDGEGSTHSSLHANMYPLAFGIVPAEFRHSVAQFIKTRGMACSVYGSQRLLEALYLQGEADYALSLLTAQHDRSWWHMLEQGSTITLEAWAHKYKNNLDWNHAWGAAPANIIQRYLVGVRPLEPGLSKLLIQPQPGPLRSVESAVPTIRGPVKVNIQNAPDAPLKIQVHLPANTTADVYLPADGNGQQGFVYWNEQKNSVEPEGNALPVKNVPAGTHKLTLT